MPLLSPHLFILHLLALISSSRAANPLYIPLVQWSSACALRPLWRVAYVRHPAYQYLYYDSYQQHNYSYEVDMK